jgi:hypothetical protein
MSTGRRIDIALGVLGAETGFIGLINSNDGAEHLVGKSQVAK